MSVSESFDIADGLYVPFRHTDRGNGPVGTFHQLGFDVGDGSGGTVTVGFQMSRLNFGMHALLVVTRVAVRDDQAAADVVRLNFDADGNERLVTQVAEAKLTVRGEGSLNFGNFDFLTMLIEPDQEVATDVMSVAWITNTNAKTYIAAVYGIVYDAEAMALVKGRQMDDLLLGIR